VTPVYPAIAKSNRIGGTVQLELTIGPDGKVADARVLKSVPVLDQAALDAVRQWEYAPTRVKGVAVPVIVNVAIDFQP
jgi:protein TonB